MVVGPQGGLPQRRYGAGEIDSALYRLVAAGRLDDAQAAAVRAELAAEPERPAVGTRTATGVVIAAYVGVALVAAGVAGLIVSNWAHLSTPARLLIFSGLTAALVGIGALLRDRLDIARGLAWVVAVPSAGGIGAAVAGSVRTNGDTRFLAAAGTAVLLSVILLALRPSTAQVVAFVAAVVVSDVAVVVRAGFDSTGAGWLFVGTGVVLAGLATTRRMPVPNVVLAQGGLVALAGLHLLADDHLGIAVALAAAVAALAYYRAATTDPALPLVLATLTVATMTPRLLDTWFHGSVGASGILALSGVVVLAVAATHVQLRRRYSRGRTSRS